MDTIARGLAIQAKNAATVPQLNQIASYRALPREAAPTIVLNSSAMAGSLVISPVVNGGSTPNTKNFAFYGMALSNLAWRSNVFPQWSVLVASSGSADTNGCPPFHMSFYYTGAGQLDIERYGDASSVEIYVDDQLVCFSAPATATGTAQAGASGTITLSSGSSATSGFYNQFYARITGGTGAGQIRQITAYNGSTKVATVDTAWTTAPDATSTYSIEHSTAGFALDGITGSLKYINITFPTASPAQPVTRKITICSSHMARINVGQNDMVSPAPPFAQVPMLVIGDSIPNGSSGPVPGCTLINQIGRQLGVMPYNLASGSTGWWARGGSNRLNFLNRIAPPAEAWEYSPPNKLSATGGTYTISVTYNGVTATTSAIAYNATASTVETALNALTFGGFSASSGVSWVGPNGQGCFCVARGDFWSDLIVIANGMVGATISINGTNLTGGSTPTIRQYVGDVAKNIPKDVAGNALPFVLLVPGSGNDLSATGYTAAKLQANAATIASEIRSRFSTAIPIFTGIVGLGDGGGSGVIGSTDLANNAAILAGAQNLPKIKNQTPFIDTYSEGLGGNCWFTGSGSVAAPTNGKTDVFKSIQNPGHPTALGVGYLAGRLTNRICKILRGELDG